MSSTTDKSRKVGQEYHCAKCGKPYVYPGGRSTCCPECNTQNLIDYYTERYSKTRGKRPGFLKAAMPRICQNCGADFVPSMPNELYCSARCAAVRNVMAMQGKPVSRVRGQRKAESRILTCVDCGAEFESARAPKRCPDCTKKHQRDYNSNWVRMRRQKQHPDAIDDPLPDASGLAPVRPAASFAKSTLAERTCRECGEAFRGGPRAWYCPECRTERKRRHGREAAARKRAGKVRPIGSTDTCAVCGEPYVVEGGLQKYCKQCAPEAVKLIDNAQSRDWNANNRERINELRRIGKYTLTCKICGSSFHGTSERCVYCSDDCRKIGRREISRVTEAKRRQLVRERSGNHGRQ